MISASMCVTFKERNRKSGQDLVPMELKWQQGWVGSPGCRGLLRRSGPLEGNNSSLETPVVLKDRAARSTHIGEDCSPPISSSLRL